MVKEMRELANDFFDIIQQELNKNREHIIDRFVKSTTEMGLTELRKRILFLLKSFDQDAIQFKGVAPFEITQEGIAQAVGKTRPKVTSELIEMEKHGLIKPILMHIEGQPRRRYAYFITQKGRELIRGMKQEDVYKLVSGKLVVAGVLALVAIILFSGMKEKER